MKKYLGFNNISIIGAIVAVCVAGYLYLVHNVVPKYIQQMLPVVEEMAQDYINGSVKVGGVNWQGGLTAEVDNVVVKDLQQQNIAVVPKTRIELRPWLAVFAPARAVSKIEVLEPEVWLRLQKDDKWNMTTLMKPSKEGESPFYGLLEVQKGKLNIETPYGKWNMGVDGSVDAGANPKYALAAKANTGKEIIEVNGLMTTKGVGKLQINAEKLSFREYAPLIKHYTAIREFAGELKNTHIIWDNNGKNTTVSGETEFVNLGGLYAIENQDHSFVINGKIKAKDSILDIQRLAAVIDNEQQLHLKGKADVHDLDNIGGQGLLTSPKLSYQKYTIEKLHLPFTVTKQLCQIDKASTIYGGGEVHTSATIDLRENTLTADIDVKNVAHVLSNRKDDVIKANGSIAVLGRKEEKDGRETFQIHAGADTLDLKWQDVTINKMNFDGDYDGHKVTVDHFSAYTGDGVLVLQGNAVPENNGLLVLKGRIADFAIDPLLNHFTDIQGKGKLSMNFDIKGTINSPEFSTAVQLRDVEIQKHKLKELHGLVAMRDKVLTIKHMGATLTQGRHILDGTVDFRQTAPLLSLDLKSRHVRVEPLVAAVTADYSLTGNLNNTMHISGTPTHPCVEGELELTDGSVQTYLLNGISGKYVYNDGFVKLQDVIVKLFIADVKLDGTLSKDKKLDFDIAAHNVNISKSPYRSKNYDIDGLLDLDGHLSGDVAAPTFVGKLASSILKINGESYTEIHGSVESNMKAKNVFDVSFKQPYQNEKGERILGTGSFVAKGNVDLIQNYVTGKVDIKNGDIAGLLRTNKLDYAVKGCVDGSLDIYPEGKASGIIFRLNSNDISAHNLHYDALAVKGVYNDNIANIEEIILLEKKDVQDKGYIKASGIIDIAGSKNNIHANAVAANPAIINVAMKNPLDIKGAMNFEATLTGSLAEPKAELFAEIVNGSLMGATFDQALARINLLEDNIYIKELFASKDVYSINGSGKIPVDAIRAKVDRKNAQAEMDIAFDLDKAELGILTTLHYFDWGIGEVAGKLSIKGTLDEPKVFGNIKVEDGSVKVHGLNPVLEHVKLDAEFTGEKATLNNLAMQLGKKGKIAIDGYYLLNSTAKDAYRMNVVAENAEISYTNMFKGKLNSELVITPQSYRDYWHRGRNTSNIVTKTTKVAKLDDSQKGQTVKKATAPIYLGPRMLTENTRPLIKGKVRLDDVVANILGVDDSEVGSETNLGLDMKVELGPKIHMLNAMFYDIWLRGGLELRGGYYSQTTADEDEDEAVIKRHNMGPDQLKINGSIEADKGNITYLRTVFKLTEGKLTWTQPGEIMPYVKLDSWTRFGKYRIFANIDGSLGDIKEDEILKLTSSPPLEKNTLIRMLTLQRESASGGNEISNDDMNNVMSVGLQMAVLGNVELWVKQTLGLDQFRVYTGKVNAGIAFDGSDTKNQLTNNEKNRYNVLISKYLTDKFMVGYTTDFHAEESVIFGQYDLGRHFNLTYSDKRRLGGERKDWYGLEYRIDFK